MEYLSYKKYKLLGGTLSETPFNILELQARKCIDRYTCGRLMNLDKQVEEVKYCMYSLIELLNSYEGYSKQQKGGYSETTDGYSISYGQASESVSKAKINEIRDIIKLHLSECKLENGTPYLYVGADRK